MLLYWARAVLLFTLLFGALNASAVVLDWSTVSWTSGALSQSYDVDNDGSNDITIAISGDTASLIGGSPQISGSSLAFALDFSNPSSTITVTITISGALARDLNFTLYDIDADRKGSSSNYGYQDTVAGLSGIASVGSVLPSVTTGSAVTYSSGTAVGQSTVAPGSSDGNVTANFNNDVISAQFSYGNSGNITGNNPDPQDFAVGNIAFKKVPEVGAARMAMLLCGIVVVVGQYARRFGWRS